ncbi:MAG: ImmA/IrrE family metallo-endopeptidase [Armatimonadota bacterium]|nr:ImmA/IrrE family metallo-endopeptidase [Armatimonadota bacterium]
MSGLHFEDEAERLAYKAWRTLKLEPPADLDRVAEKLGLVVEYREFVPQIDGFYLRLPHTPPIIAVNSSYVKPLERRRFTLAHEIGHHLLARRISNPERLFFLDTERGRRSVLERACDRFAALLLMPEDLVRSYFAELESNRSKRVAVMASRFGVSTWAMRRRLRELGLNLWDKRRGG